jgi:DNA replication protein DnaC
MLMNPTLDKLKTLQLWGMLAALEDQQRTPDIDTLTFEERLGLLIDREETTRADRRLRTRLTQAKLRVKASIEDIDYRASRGLNKNLMLDLASGRWIDEHHNLLITGPTGVGKTYLACALANQACRLGKKALYQRLPRLLFELEIGKGDGRYQTLLANLQRVDLLILDDWGLAPLTDSGRRDLLEILDDRYNTRSTLITSQLPIDAWHPYLADPTLADAILDRLIHNAHKLALRGDSLRKTKGGLTTPTSPEAQ